MILDGHRRSRWFALLGLGVAIVFVLCHTLGAGSYAGGNPALFQTTTTVNLVDGQDMAPCGIFTDCAVTLTGTKSLEGKAFAPNLVNATAVPSPVPFSFLPSWEALHAASMVMAPHRSSLQLQSVLLRI